MHSFAATNDGQNPQGGLVMDGAGNLYGSTYAGGTDNYGIVFKLSPTGQETLFHSFTGTNGDGRNPQGYLTLDGAGNLYGTTPFGGGATNNGIVFKLDSNGNETVLYSFTGTNGDGAGPQGGLIMDSAGKHYGTTSGGGTSSNGTVFELMP